LFPTVAGSRGLGLNDVIATTTLLAALADGSIGAGRGAGGSNGSGGSKGCGGFRGTVAVLRLL
jgi:hypothetical protein